MIKAMNIIFKSLQGEVITRCHQPKCQGTSSPIQTSALVDFNLIKVESQTAQKDRSSMFIFKPIYGVYNVRIMI